MTLAEALAALDGKDLLSADDALAVRKIVYADDAAVSRDEAEALFKLNADAGHIAPEWSALFIEAMTDHIVRQQQPSGYVDDATAAWLTDLISGRQKLRGDEIEMLLHVLDEADHVPESFAAYVLKGVRALALWRIRTQGALARSDIERLRRVIFSKGGDTNIAVTREEAEVLFDINDALNGKADDAIWSQFFAQAVGNAVLYAPVWTADAQTELAQEAWVADTSMHPLRRLESLADAQQTAAGMAEGFHDLFHFDFDGADLKRLGEREAADEAMESSAAAVTADEAHWLVDRIGRTPGFNAGERALVAFLKDNASSIDPALADYVAKLGDDDGTLVQRAAS